MGEKRALRIPRGQNRYITSIYLEKPFWLTLEEMADEFGISLPELVSHIDGRYENSGNAPRNLASCLRVACLSWQTDRKL
ncbi:MAG: ribbon-helix-helix domain-containing protein [Rhodospirillales bacterium]|nr:ribbon-helix-helix domain-containing protein [Rhodospirillales bacterium]MCW8862633.1 ribbon-helix-helix domain-containing protein [Rhodospirillales bacterium]MCW8951166.1 ribbon-helix-helix domain-containing protein [Rhodospirillales bacterium]MCW9001426.1 ribbon-helix-helix domain-containing protein [Rhodospirillales bacterium]MCW9039991.1 ribbon-helix-helix domain-containing protein [Rhodospirillales bacterium]